MTQYPDLILRPKRERSILHRHPWIFSGSVAQCEATSGDIVAVKTHEGQLLGYGFYDPARSLSCRMFEWTETPQEVDTPGYWKPRMEAAWKLRLAHLDTEKTTCYRMLHAEGDLCPGILADWYDPVLVIQLILPGTQQRKSLWMEVFQELGIQHIYEKPRATGRESDREQGHWWTTSVEPEVPVLENGLRFEVNVERGQKTGFFIDQRDNRALLQRYASGKSVLNTFCYTGGFSVYALAGGASQVVSVDISADAVQQAEHNVQLNFPEATHTGVTADCFEYLSQLPENEYDLIVLDPPAFAKSKRTVENASRGYKQINLKAFRKIRPNGYIFTFSCSQNISSELFQKIVFGAAADAGRNVRVLHHLEQPPDHPVSLYHPEGAYLKGLVLHVD